MQWRVQRRHKETGNRLPGYEMVTHQDYKDRKDRKGGWLGRILERAGWRETAVTRASVGPRCF